MRYVNDVNFIFISIFYKIIKPQKKKKNFMEMIFWVRNN